MTARPSTDEFHSFYGRYIDDIGDEDPLERLQVQARDLLTLCRPLSAKQARSRYAPGKWSVLDVLVHLIDTERVMSYRAFAFARGEQAALPGFDHEAYVQHAQADSRALAEVLDAYEAVRASTLMLYRSFGEAELNRRGVASGHEVTVRALVFITAGHEFHHLTHLRERYLT